MRADAGQRTSKKNGKARGEEPPFNLEPDAPAGKVPQRVVDELVRCRTEAKDYAQAYTDAIKAQAEKHKLKPSALKKYVNAIEADKREDLRKEVDDVEKLLAE